MGLFGFLNKKTGVSIDMSPKPASGNVHTRRAETRKRGSSDSNSAVEGEVGAATAVESRFPGLYVGMILSVVDSTDIIIFHGKLAEFSSDGLTLKRPNGVTKLPVLELNRAVKIRGYDRNLEAFCIKVIVRWSSETQFTIASLTPLAFDEHRACFRVPIYKWAIVDHNHMRKTCVTTDISLGGAAIVTSEEFLFGDQVTLIIKLVEGSGIHKLSGKVVRSSPHQSGKYVHGMQFDTLSEELKTHLLDDIFLIQSGLADKEGN